MARTVKFEGRNISVPDDATDDEVASIIGSSTTEPRTSGRGEQLVRQLGLSGRAALEAGGSLPAILGNAMEYVGVKGAGGNIGTTISDAIGLPAPESGIEKFSNEVVKTMAPGTAGYKVAAKVLPKASQATKAEAYREAAVGGAGAGAASAASTNTDPVTGAYLGMATGPAGKAIGDTGAKVINAGRGVFQDATTQAAKKVQALAGDNVAEQAATLRALRGEVRGELPTSGLAATVDPKMAYQKELQEQARRRMVGAYTDRDAINQAAQEAPITRIAAPGRPQGQAARGGAVPQSRHEAYRTNETRPGYDASAGDRVTLTDDLEALLAGVEARPAVVKGGRAFRQGQTNAQVAGRPTPNGPIEGTPGTPAMPEVRDSAGILIRPEVPGTPGVPGSRSIEDLQQVKNELSARIKRLERTDPDEAYRLAQARDQLNTIMGDASEGFRNTTNRYRELSIPQNQANVAQILSKALTGPSGRKKTDSFLSAVENAAGTVKKAGMPAQNRQLSQVMSRAQMEKIDAVTRSLRREAAYDDIGRSAIPNTQSGADEAREMIPALLDNRVTFAKKALNFVGMGKDIQIDKIIDEATLHPERMAQLLERATPDQRIKVLSTLREMNPKGASIGLIAGQE